MCNGEVTTEAAVGVGFPPTVAETVAPGAGGVFDVELGGLYFISCMASLGVQ